MTLPDTARGVTGFVLKYRLAHIGEDAIIEEFTKLYAEPTEISRNGDKVIPLGAADGSPS